jgi:hypothetical protein
MIDYLELRKPVDKQGENEEWKGNLDCVLACILIFFRGRHGLVLE